MLRIHRELIDVVSRIPLSRILLETDSPYLSPAVSKRSPNHLWTLPSTAAAVAMYRNIPLSILLQTANSNAKRIYQLSNSIWDSPHCSNVGGKVRLIFVEIGRFTLCTRHGGGNPAWYWDLSGAVLLCVDSTVFNLLLYCGYCSREIFDVHKLSSLAVYTLFCRHCL